MNLTIVCLFICSYFILAGKVLIMHLGGVALDFCSVAVRMTLIVSNKTQCHVTMYVQRLEV